MFKVTCDKDVRKSPQEKEGEEEGEKGEAMETDEGEAVDVSEEPDSTKLVAEVHDVEMRYDATLEEVSKDEEGEFGEIVDEPISGMEEVSETGEIVDDKMDGENSGIEEVSDKGDDMDEIVKKDGKAAESGVKEEDEENSSMSESNSSAQIGKIDDETLGVYLRALEAGQETLRHIRLMVVGMSGVGKTSLIRKICEKGIYDVKTTIGIDLIVKACEVDEDGHWKVKEVSKKDVNGYGERLDKIMEQQADKDRWERKHDNLSPMTEDRKLKVAKTAMNEFTEEKQPGIYNYIKQIEGYKKKPTSEKKNRKRKASVSIWDFAGQSVYYSTHQFFLSSRSIYLLVVDISRNLDEKVPEDYPFYEGFTCRDYLIFWINSIYTYAKKEQIKARTSVDLPTIVLVGTHKDKLPGSDKAVEHYKNMYFDEVKRSFISPLWDMIHINTFLVSCITDSPEVFDTVKSEIFEIAKNQPFLEETSPAKWIPLERSTEERKAKGHECMTFDELCTMNAATELPLSNEPEIKLFLQFQHFLGNLLFYNVGELDHKVILNPQWIIDVFKLFVTHQGYFEKQDVEDAWNDYMEKAQLKPKLIHYLIDQSNRNRKEAELLLYKDVVEYMKYFDVMAMPVIYSQEEKQQHEEFFIVPCLLKKMTPEESKIQKIYFQPDPIEAKMTRVLCFAFEDRFLPRAVFHRLLATCIRKWEISERDTGYVLYNRMGVFKLDTNSTLTLWYAGSVIFLRIADYSMQLKDCVGVKNEIRKMLNQILVDYVELEGVGTLFKEYILCEANVNEWVDILFKNPCKKDLIPVEIFHETKNIDCYCVKQTHCINKEVALKYWYMESAKPTSQDSMQKLEEWFEHVKKTNPDLDGIPTESELYELSAYIDVEYWDLGIRFGLNNATLEQIRDENIYNVRKRIYYVLLALRRFRGSDLTYKDLAIEIKNAKEMLSKRIKNLKAEYGQLDEETLRLYFDVLKNGTEYVRHIRLMVVGMFGVGKTSLIRNMCHGNLDNVKSTVGIDVSVNACEVDGNRQWKITNGEEKAEKYYKLRINNAMKHTKEKEDSSQSNTTTIQYESQSRPINNVEKSPEIENGEGGNTAVLKESIDSFREDTLMDEAGGSEPINFEQNKKHFQSVINTNKELRKDLSAVQENDEPEKRITTVSIWDFAGQSIYYSTHHFFLSTRAIYLLVVDLSKELNECVPEDNLSGKSTEEQATSMPASFTYLDAFKFWMNSIYTYTHRRPDDSAIEYRPTIVLVGTFRDKVGVANPIEHMEDFFEQALKPFQDTEIVKLVHEKKFFLHENDPKEYFDELKIEISDIAEKQPFWNEEVPAQWMPLERLIEARKGKPKDEKNQHENDLMELEEVVDKDKGTELPLLDKRKLKLFLKFQHVLGNVLYFDADQLDEKIILNPQWILDVFKLFVRHNDIPRKPEYGKMREEYKKHAILRPELITHMITNSGNPTFKVHQTEIIRYMEHLDIMAKPLRYPEENSDTDSDTDNSDDEDVNKGSQSKGKAENTAENFYYVPCLMTELPPSNESLAVNESTPTLCLVFKHKFLPAFVFHRLLATCITKWEIYSHKDKKYLYKGCGRFYLNSSRQSFLTIWYKDHIIYMNISTHENVLDDEECTDAKELIEAMIQKIFSIHVKCATTVMDKDNLQYDEYIFCPKCEKDAQERDNDTDADSDIVKRFIEISRLQKNEKVACPNNHSHESERLLHLWFSDDTETRKLELIGKERKELICWIKTNKNGEMNERTFADLACYIGREYVALGIELDISLAWIDRLKEENRNVQTIIKNMLIKWVQNNKGASMKSLITALFKVLGYNDGEGKCEKVYTQQALQDWLSKREMSSTPKDKELGEIARYIGKRYRRLANILRVPSATVDHIVAEQTFSYDRALRLLKAWKTESTKKTFKALKRKLGKVLYIDFE